MSGNWGVSFRDSNFCTNSLFSESVNCSSLLFKKSIQGLEQFCCAVFSLQALFITTQSVEYTTVCLVVNFSTTRSVMPRLSGAAEAVKEPIRKAVINFFVSNLNKDSARRRSQGKRASISSKVGMETRADFPTCMYKVLCSS